MLFIEHVKNLPFYIMLLWFFNLLYLILLLSISSFKIMLRLKPVAHSFWKNSFNALFIDKIFQCLKTILLILGIDWIYVNTSRIFVSFAMVISLSFKRSFMSGLFTAFVFIY